MHAPPEGGVPPPFLIPEQRELRALAKQTMGMVQFMTRECCERAIQGLIPAIREAVGANDTRVPADLEEREGLDLIDAILGRRQPTSTTDNNNRTKRAREKETPPPPKGDAPKGDSPKKDVPPKGQGPPRKQSKVPSPAILHHVDSHVEEEDKEAEDDEDEEEDEEEEEWEDWDLDTHGTITEVVRFGVHNHVFGLFIRARQNGSGQRKPLPFFADAASLAALDDMEDRKKYRRVTKVLLQGVRECLAKEDDGDALEDHKELVALLKGSEWGREVVAQLTKSDSSHSDGGKGE